MNRIDIEQVIVIVVLVLAIAGIITIGVVSVIDINEYIQAKDSDSSLNEEIVINNGFQYRIYKHRVEESGGSLFIVTSIYKTGIAVEFVKD